MAEPAAGESAEDNSVMRIGKRCYVGNLAWKTSWQDLKDKFRVVGEVVYANVMRDDTGRSKGWGIVEFETPEEAVQAVNTFNGTELAGRKMLVREDREDRDVKQYNRENGLEPPEAVPPRVPRGGGGGRDGRGRGRGGRGGGRGGPPRDGGAPEGEGQQQEGSGDAPGAGEPEGPGETSGLQVVVQGIPWKFTWRDVKPLFEPCGAITRADVVYGRDGRSRGYATVRFETQEAAEKAIAEWNGKELEGRTLTVKLDKYA